MTKSEPFDHDTTRHCLGCWPERVSTDVRDVDYVRPGWGVVRAPLCAECREGVEVLVDRGRAERSDDDEA
jgi:hypothetical protein